ncbi:unnamed protein product, partial [Cyprideis torosa]
MPLEYAICSKCVICSDTNLVGDKNVLLTLCGHIFHGICLENRMKDSLSCPCPTCQLPVERSNLKPLFFDVDQEDLDLLDNLRKAKHRGVDINTLNTLISKGVDINNFTKKCEDINNFTKKCEDINIFDTKKTIAQGILNVALLTVNGSQLKYIFHVGAESSHYYC